ncbi:uncharacterized protein LOC115331923 isoform X1 [Ixodes scapularis]|uniref:uncharacterized protein LOC115331923 isoform X1 n=1 Tax=Ixodes scapularis TaxID=6945 RepID=UPI001A9DA99E|nr:uncharacterized protein LOC115331923 isoform X1 [Ixodes scapularis]
MENQKTPVAKKLPSWLRSFRTSKNAAPKNDENFAKPAIAQTKGFLRSYRKSLGFKKNADAEEAQAGDLDVDNFARGSLMSIRKLWAAEATGKTFHTRASTEGVSKKPCAKPHTSGSPSKIPISAQMQVQHKTHRRSFHQSWCPSNKENCVPSSTVFGQTTDGRNYSSAGSSDGNLASEIVLSAARHAKNRRSSCNFKEQEVWKAAVNNVGLPRTSTETGQLPKLVDDRVRNTPMSLVNDSANITDKVTNGEAVQSWVLHHNPVSTTTEVQPSGRFASQSLLDCATTIPKSLYFPPVIPPRTYLAKLAHAKAHLARTGTIEPRAKERTQKALPAGVRIAPCKQKRVNVAGTFFPPSLSEKPNCNLADVHLPNCSRIATAQCMSRVPSNPQISKRLTSSRGQHNPAYGIASHNRTSRHEKAGCGIESDAMADDEISVMNCSCQQCLQRFSNIRWQPQARRGNLGRNIQAASKPDCISPVADKTKHLDNPGNHCQCCHCKNLAGISKTTTTERATPPICKQPITKKPAAAKSILNRQDEISRVVEEAVKASIEKLLSMNSISLSRSRSVESLQEPSPTKKKLGASPLKYILLSSCRTGAGDLLADLTTETKTESGIVMSPQSSSTEEASAERISFRNGLSGLDSSAIVQPSRLELERTASLPSLVESCSPSTSQVSTAYIKLVKRVKKVGDKEEAGSQKMQVKEDQDERRTSPADTHSTCSSSTTGECWHTAESLVGEDSCSQTEGMTCNLDEDGPSLGTLKEGFQHSADCLKVGLGIAYEVSQNDTSVSSENVLPKAKPEMSASCASMGSLLSRRSPDGWERTPPTDQSAEAEDEPSELNPQGAENCEDPCCSDDTGTSDDEDDQRILEEVIRKGMGMTPPIKLPVKLPRPVKMPRKFKPAEFFGGKAKLKLSAYTNSGHLTIHIIRALKLRTSHGASVNAYVKVALQPDYARRAHWRTPVVKSCRNPEFDHKFSFELMAEDADKRLFITVWHRDTDNKRSELLGSMSFAMSKISDCTQYAKGWYRLLRQDLGMRKHFAARCGKKKDGERAPSA